MNLPAMILLSALSALWGAWSLEEWRFRTLSFWLLSALLPITCIAKMADWQYLHGWPGLFVPDFVIILAKTIITAVVGIFIGAFILGGPINRFTQKRKS